MGHLVLVTGAAGFIGMHVARRLLETGNTVVGVDNLSSYYDRSLKEARLGTLRQYPDFRWEKLDLADKKAVAELFASHRFAHVVHLAAQPGVRHSLTDPQSYVDSNLMGFVNVLEGCRHTACKHFVYASSSSVYGANTGVPFRTSDNVDHPVSLYGATKKANELLAHAYSHLFALPATGLRFFTVYGPWGRPDMAVWLFTAAILEGRTIRLFNDGHTRRDFTYVDDVAEAVVRLMDRAAVPDPGWSGVSPDPATSSAPWRIYNVGNRHSIEITELIELIERAVGKRAIRELAPMQPGDVVETWADTTDLEEAIGFQPTTPISEGVRRFVAWYREFYRI